MPTDEALVELLSPDGYYSYFSIDPPISDDTEVDLDVVKKQYRRLSLRHHPDKPGGDAETFRVLNRAQRVLSDPKLRQQYNVLGIDLLDDEDTNTAGGTDEQGKSDSSGDPQESHGVIQHLANSTLTAIIQFGVKTLMMGGVSTILVRYRLTLYPALAFMTFIIYRIIRQQSLPGSSLYDTIPALLIISGMLIMSNAAALGESYSWTFRYWLGESLVIAMFCYNSLTDALLAGRAIFYVGLSLFSILAALWFRGRIWNYGIVLGIVAVLALVVALLFPMIELLLDAILNEKLKKVGEKVRQQHILIKNYYEAKETNRK